MRPPVNTSVNASEETRELRAELAAELQSIGTPADDAEKNRAMGSL